MAGYIVSGIVAILGIVVWYLEHRARTRAEIDRAEAEEMAKEAARALKAGDTRVLRRILGQLRTHEKR